MMSTRWYPSIVAGVVLLAAASGAPAAEKKVIRLWQTESEPQSLAVLNQMATEYEKTHPDV